MRTTITRKGQRSVSVSRALFQPPRLLAMIMVWTTMVLPLTTRRATGTAWVRGLGVSGLWQQQQQHPLSKRCRKPSPASLWASRNPVSGGGLGVSRHQRAFRNGWLLSRKPVNGPPPAPGTRWSSCSGSASPSALFMGRRRRSKQRGPKPPPRGLAVPANGETPAVAMVHPERYHTLLGEKVAGLEALLAEALAANATTTDPTNQIRLPPTEVFESPREGYRMRANFKLWRSGGPSKEKSATDANNETTDSTAEIQQQQKEDVEEETETPFRVDYVMFEKGDKTPYRVTKYPMGYPLLQDLMDPVREAIESVEELRLRVNDIRFLTTLRGDALVTITYNRPIGDEWSEAATKLARQLQETVVGPNNSITLVGRSRKIKLVVRSDDNGNGNQTDEATVRETLTVPMDLEEASEDDSSKDFCYIQTEGAFSQPNAVVCQSMLAWAHDATKPANSDSDSPQQQEKDLCELYCGNGCFTVVLASNFRRVVATEMSKASVDLARHNLASNDVGNTRVARLNAEDFVRAYRGEPFRRLRRAGVGMLAESPATAAAPANTTGEVLDDEIVVETTLDFDRLHTLFVDPPRAGLDETCRELASKFQRVVYVSCNPETLARDVSELVETHEITRLAAFDQFPYTHHLEAGVVLERKASTPGE